MGQRRARPGKTGVLPPPPAGTGAPRARPGCGAFGGRAGAFKGGCPARGRESFSTLSALFAGRVRGSPGSFCPWCPGDSRPGTAPGSALEKALSGAAVVPKYCQRNHLFCLVRKKKKKN